MILCVAFGPSGGNVRRIVEVTYAETCNVGAGILRSRFQQLLAALARGRALWRAGAARLNAEYYRV